MTHNAIKRPDPAAELKLLKDFQIKSDDAFRALEHRVRIFVNLPFASLDRLRLLRQLDEIGRLQPVTDDASSGT